MSRDSRIWDQDRGLLWPGLNEFGVDEMIFKIAHICYCGDAVKAKKQLREYGYRKFLSERIRPMKITRDLSFNCSEEIDISLWNRPGAISIEILETNNYSQNEGLIRPVLNALIPGAVSSDKNIEAVELNDGRYVLSFFLGYPAYMKSDTRADDPTMDSILLFSQDVDESVHFWTAVGLHCIRHSDMSALFVLKCTFTRKDFFIYIVKSDREKLSEDINSPGFHILGLISSSAEQERRRMASFSLEVTPIEQITINERKLTILYARSPEGLLTEIISLN